MELLHHSSGRRDVKIHQHIAAKHDVHAVHALSPCQVGQVQQVQVAPLHHPPQGGPQHIANLPVRHHPLETPGLEPGRRVAERPFAVVGLCRLGQELRLYVGRQDADVPVRQIGQQPGQHHRQGVGLLPRAATGAPQAQRASGLAPSRHQGWQDLLLQCGKDGRLPEKIGFPHTQVRGQRAHLVVGKGRGQQRLKTRRHGAETQLQRRALQAAQQVKLACRRERQTHLPRQVLAERLQQGFKQRGIGHGAGASS